MNDHQVLPYCVQVYWEEAWCMSWSECCGCAMAFYAACQWHMMVQYCCDSGSTNKLFCKCFLLALPFKCPKICQNLFVNPNMYIQWPTRYNIVCVVVLDFIILSKENSYINRYMPYYWICMLYDSISRNFCDRGQCRQDNK